MSKRKFYAVVEGRQPGLYDEWFGADGAEAQIKGYANAVYKSFQSRTEAEMWYTKIAGAPPTHIAITANADEEETYRDYLSLHREALAAGKVVIYTDGGCIGNPDAGGYGTVLLFQERRKELSGGFAQTTNNRMELMACLAGLRALKRKNTVVIFSDSSYVVDGIQKGWARRWRDNGWRRGANEDSTDVKNADLWKELLELTEFHDVTFIQVRGHAGVPENERCHQLASEATRKARLPVDAGFVSGERVSG
jgi:ribonuclease HI